MRARTTVAAALALIVLAALAPRAGAATVIPNTGADDYDPVTPDANCSLREAIQAGNVFGDFGGCLYTGGDVGSVTILLSGGVTYERTLTDAAEEDTNATGDFDAMLQSLTIGVLGSAPGSAVIAGNGATSGGRIIEVLNGQLHLTGVTLRGGNAGLQNGGAILKPNGGGPMSLTNVTLSGNVAEDGGGLYVGDNATLVNTTISGNSSLRHGGGIYKGAGQFDANNLTIAGNTADPNVNGGDGGGIFVDGSGFNISNSIVAGNVDVSPGAETPDCVATLATSLGHNLIGNSTGCNFAGSNGGPQTGDVLDPPYGPGLGALQSNGGATQTHALLAGSPAIDAGNPAPPDNIVPACATADQRGTVRPVGARCDIGAFEYTPTAVKGPPPTGDGKKKCKKKKKKKKAAAAKKCKKKKKKKR